MTEVSAFVREFVEEGINHLEIGMITTNPKTGKTVKITRGAFWGKYGLSNFWHWREVLEDGKLSHVEENGYGWTIENPILTLRCEKCKNTFKMEDFYAGPPDYCGYPATWQMVICECGGYASVIKDD